MIPEGVSKEELEPSHSTPPILLSPHPHPHLAQVQPLRDKEYRPPAPSLPLTPCLGNCALDPSMFMSHGLYTCMCPLQDAAVAMQVPCLPRSMHVSPTMVPRPVYRAATSKVRFRVRNL